MNIEKVYSVPELDKTFKTLESLNNYVKNLKRLTQKIMDTLYENKHYSLIKLKHYRKWVALLKPMNQKTAKKILQIQPGKRVVVIIKVMYFVLCIKNRKVVENAHSMYL